MITNTFINIEKAIELVNKKSTTVDQLCKFLYDDIQKYQDSRESFYMKEFKELCEDGEVEPNSYYFADGYANTMLKKIQKDVKKFSIDYANKSIDLVLDSVNENKFKTKKSSNNLLVLLDTLKEINEEI
jgi:hypothetical protein